MVNRNTKIIIEVLIKKVIVKTLVELTQEEAKKIFNLFILEISENQKKLEGNS